MTTKILLDIDPGVDDALGLVYLADACKRNLAEIVAIGTIEILSNVVDRYIGRGRYPWSGQEQLFRHCLPLEHLGLAIRELDACIDQGDEVRSVELPPALLARQ